MNERFTPNLQQGMQARTAKIPYTHFNSMNPVVQQSIVYTIHGRFQCPFHSAPQMTVADPEGVGARRTVQERTCRSRGGAQDSAGANQSNLIQLNNDQAPSLSTSALEWGFAPLPHFNNPGPATECQDPSPGYSPKSNFTG